MSLTGVKIQFLAKPGYSFSDYYWMARQSGSNKYPFFNSNGKTFWGLYVYKNGKIEYSEYNGDTIEVYNGSSWIDDKYRIVEFIAEGIVFKIGSSTSSESQHMAHLGTGFIYGLSGYRLVSESDLIAIANAIRAKGGTSANLTFPSGFISAIENISTSTE